jgi:hypothetical protein
MGRCKHCSDLMRMLQKADEAPLPEESQVERIQAMIAALAAGPAFSACALLPGHVRYYFSQCSGDRHNAIGYGGLGRAATRAKTSRN